MSGNRHWNALTNKEARDLVSQVRKGEFSLHNLRGHIKSVIGMCSDQEDHQAIAVQLWRVADEISILTGYEGAKR